MKVGIIGAGFTGLSAAYELTKKGHKVVVLESEEAAGGLAIGFEKQEWNWSLEKYYHHWFTNDKDILKLAREINYPVITKRPTTSTYMKGKSLQLDSPASLLKFNELSLFNRMRVGIVILYLKITPFWKVLERTTAEKFLKRYMGRASWRVMWKPLFKGKFGKHYRGISASWFWARIKKRTPSLSYPEGGFQRFADRLVKEIEKQGGEFHFEKGIEVIEEENERVVVQTRKETYEFDRVICTLPTPFFIKMVKDLPRNYLRRIKPLKGLGAITLVIRLKKQFLVNGTYWLNINEESFPFLAVVEHTNYMDKKNYGMEHLLYVGNYLNKGHRYFKSTREKILGEFFPFLKKINPSFSKSQIIGYELFKTPFAQPVLPLRYSKNVLPLETPVKGLFLANIQQVYPWDRGTNYAVELGKKVAKLVVKS